MGVFMKKLCINFLIFSSYFSGFGMFRARDIFEAIGQHDEKAVVYFIVGGQVNYTKKLKDWCGDVTLLTPLVKAICIGDENIIQLLIEGGADVNQYSVVSESEHKEVKSPLEWVMLKLWLKNKIVAQKVITLLLKNPHLCKRDKDVALRHGCTLGRTSPVSFLLEFGADPLFWNGYEVSNAPNGTLMVLDGGREKKVVDPNSFSMATTFEVRDILFAHVISQMRKENPDLAAELEKLYRVDED